MKFAVLTHARGKFTPIWRPVGVAGVVQAVGIFAYQGSTAISSVLQGTAVSTKLRAHTEEYTPSSKQPFEVYHVHRNRYVAALLPIVGSVVTLLPSSAAHAVAAEAAPDGFLELVIHTVEALGPLGPAAFIATVAMCECVPLFPTQPLSVASGLLFGAQHGALYMLVGTTTAALLAYNIARGVGRPLAERIIREEMAEGGKGENDEAAPGPVQAKLQEVQETIEQGTFWQQTGAVCFLRLTPFVPFSASNYVLGLSPLPMMPYLLGTASGMAFWSVVYASIGGASRALLRRGADPDALLSDMLEKMGNMTESAGIAVVASGAVALIVYGLYSLWQRALEDPMGVTDSPSTAPGIECGELAETAGKDV